MTAGYTYGREPDAEAVAAAAIDQVRQAVVAALPRDAYRSVLLVGGFGRGEGGVRRDPEGRPHLSNNLDVLIISRGRWQTRGEVLRRAASAALAPLGARLGVGIDAGVMPEWRLRLGPGTVFAYDLCHGHRVLAGDPTFARSLAIDVDAIDGEDVLALIANRGTLLLINEEMMATGRASRAALARHVAKAIIGYGDAWLWSRGLYHWSYAEKARRMARAQPPGVLGALYARAITHRFTPATAPLDGVELETFHAALWPSLEAVHAAVAAHVDAAAGSWPAFAARARWRQRLLGRGPSLPRLFPLVAYRGHEPQARDRLGAAGPDRATLRRAFLRRWGVVSDVNFAAAAERLALPAEVAS